MTTSYIFVIRYFSSLTRTSILVSKSPPLLRSATQHDIAHGTTIAEAEEKQETIIEFKPLSCLVGGTQNNLAKVAQVEKKCSLYDFWNVQ